MNDDQRNSSKQVLLSVLGVAILIVAVVGISFAAFTYTRSGVRENVVTTGAVTMSYKENSSGINITNAIPTDEVSAVKATAVNNSAASGNTSTNDNVFDFTVDATVSTGMTVTYDVVAVKANSTDSNCAYKVKETDTDVYTAEGRIGTAGEDTTTVVKAAEGTEGEAGYKAAVVGDAGAYSLCTIVGDADIRLRLDKNTSADTFTINSTTGAEEATNASTVFTAARFTGGTTANSKTGTPADDDMMYLAKDQTFTADGTHYYRLWMWVDKDAYKVDATQRSYKVKVNVYGKAE